MQRHEKKRDLFDIRSGKELLVALLIGGGIFTLMGTAPWLLAGAIPAVMALKDNRENRKKLSYVFWYARKRKYISVVPQSGKMRIALTKEGMRAARFHLMDMKATGKRRTETWDKKWRLILFDVSVGEHNKRNAFRQLVKRLGATKLQQSVWVYPHHCSEEVSFLCAIFGFDERHVRVVVAESIGNDRAFRKHFGLPLI